MNTEKRPNPNPPDMLEIVFETRNKAYGAYVLRRNYDVRMRNAIIVMLTLVGLLVGICFSSARGRSEKETFTIVEVKPLETPPDIERPEVPVVPAEPIVPQTMPTLQHVIPDVLKDRLVNDDQNPVANVDDLKDKAVGTKTVDGDSTARYVTNNPDPAPPADPGPPVIHVRKPTQEDTVFTYVEMMPEFPGGAMELKKFLAKAIKYPENAKAAGIEGDVVVSFIVNTNGTIEEAKIIRDIGGGCGKEALRVIKGMPSWKPGSQNGKAVRVKFTLPIKFRIN